MSGVTVTALNVAATVVDEVSTTVHVLAAAHPPPIQPPNVEERSGLAVKVTVGAEGEPGGSVVGYRPVQIPAWQVRPDPATVPVPFPVSLTDRVT